MNPPRPFTLQSVTLAQLRQQVDALSPLIDLARPYYLHPEATVRSAADRSDRVYLAREAEGAALVGCFFVQGRPSVVPPAPFGGAAYGGLALTREDQVGGGVLRHLLEAWRHDVRQDEQGGRPRLMWGMTCLPFVLELAHDVFDSVSPALDGSFDEAAAKLARLLHPGPAEAGAHPFLLRRATFSRYSPAAWKVLSRVPSAARAWMDGLGLDPDQGDRVLFHFRSGPG